LGVAVVVTHLEHLIDVEALAEIIEVKTSLRTVMRCSGETTNTVVMRFQLLSGV
jgi:hypothetical protein